jgi:rubredoxin
MPVTKTCETCGYKWNPNPWRKCPRCSGSKKAFEPSLDEIRSACEAIQSTWSASERRRRLCYGPPSDGVARATLVLFTDGE